MKTSDFGKPARIRANPGLESVFIALSTPRWAGPTAQVPEPAPTRNLLRNPLEDYGQPFGAILRRLDSQAPWDRLHATTAE